MLGRWMAGPFFSVHASPVSTTRSSFHRHRIQDTIGCASISKRTRRITPRATRTRCSVLPSASLRDSARIWNPEFSTSTRTLRLNMFASFVSYEYQISRTAAALSRPNEGASANRHPPRGSSERSGRLSVGRACHAPVRVPVAELLRSASEAR